MVVGSYNADLAVICENIPRPGETALGKKFNIGSGGKGSNQAVGIKRLGADVYFVGRIGNDVFAANAREMFGREGIDTRFVFESADAHTGVALISINEKGENSITVAPGANNCLSKDDIKRSEAVMSECSHLLIQLEIPLETVEYAVSAAKKKGLAVVLNPAPAHRNVSAGLLKSVDVLTPNEHEAGMLSGIEVKNTEDAVSAGKKLLETGAGQVIITCGAKGSVLINKEGVKRFPAYKVEVVDTTGAGDAFNAGLVYALSRGHTISEAIDFGSRAGALEATRLGVADAMPTLEEMTNKSSATDKHG